MTKSVFCRFMQTISTMKGEMPIQNLAVKQETYCSKVEFTQATMLNTRKRIGSTVYVKRVFVKNDTTETMQDKIYRLIKNELILPQQNDIMALLQTEQLPERSSLYEQ